MAIWVFLRGSNPGQQLHRLPEPGGIGSGFGLGDEIDHPVGVLLREDVEDGVARLLGHAVGGAVPFFHPGGVEFEKGHFYRSFRVFAVSLYGVRQPKPPSPREVARMRRKEWRFRRSRERQKDWASRFATPNLTYLNFIFPI